MGTGGTPSLGSPKSGCLVEAKLRVQRLNIDGTTTAACGSAYEILIGTYSKFYGQAERAISNGQLNVLLRLHIRPINAVVFHGPS